MTPLFATRIKNRQAPLEHRTAEADRPLFGTNFPFQNFRVGNVIDAAPRANTPQGANQPIVERMNRVNVQTRYDFASTAAT
jgi:hypothetical protein